LRVNPCLRDRRLFAAPCSAQVRQLTDNGFTISAGLKAAAGFISTGNTNFGAGFLESDGSLNRHVTYALAWPGAAAKKEAFGGSETYELIESQLVVTY
jgi:hypothetical protein